MPNEDKDDIFRIFYLYAITEANEEKAAERKVDVNRHIRTE